MSHSREVAIAMEAGDNVAGVRMGTAEVRILRFSRLMAGGKGVQCSMLTWRYVIALSICRTRFGASSTPCRGH